MKEIIKVNKIHYEQFLDKQIEYNKQALKELRDDKKQHITVLRTLEDKLNCEEEYDYFYNSTKEIYFRKKKTLPISQENRNIYI